MQLVPIKYFCGPVLGASDYCFRVERGGGGFGSTDDRVRQLVADTLENTGNLPAAAEAADGLRRDLEGDRLAVD